MSWRLRTRAGRAVIPPDAWCKRRGLSALERPPVMQTGHRDEPSRRTARESEIASEHSHRSRYRRKSTSPAVTVSVPTPMNFWGAQNYVPSALCMQTDLKSTPKNPPLFRTLTLVLG